MNETNTGSSFIKEFATPLSILAAGLFIAIGAYMALNNEGSAAGPGTGTMTASIDARAISSEDHIRGDANARVIMLEYSDTECPFCKSFDTTARQVMEKYGANGDVAWVYRHFPIPALHSKAPKEAEAMECAAEQGGNDVFWAYSDKLYSTTASNNSLDIGRYNSPTPGPGTDAGQLSDFAVELGLDKAQFEQCLASDKYAERVAQDVADADAAGGTGTPYIVFISKDKISKDVRAYLDSVIPTVGPQTFVISEDGRKIAMNGALPFEYVDTILEKLLN